MSPPISLDLISSCRLCLSQEGLLPLFPDTESQEDIFISMPKRIMTCVAIEVSQEDNFPKNICEVCKKSIDDWEKFKEQCDRVNSTLHQIVDSQTSAEYVEKLRNNLGGAPSALLFSDVDGSLFERESLFGTLDDSSQVDGTDVLNISLSDELLSENRVQPINASNLLSDELGGNQSITSDLLPDKIICGNSQSSPNLLLSDGITLENPKSSLTSSNLLMSDKVSCESPWLHSASNVSSSNLFESTEIEYLLKTDENPDVGNRNISNQIEGLTECGDRDGNNQYSCELCENSFSDFTKLLEHDDIDHNTLLKNFSCEVCNKMFVSENRIALHTCEVDCNGQVVETSRERFPCEFCDKDFIYFSRLLCHDDSHHADIPRHFSCQECGDDFLSENRVNMHMRSRHRLGKNVERFPCGLCKRDFITFNRLLNHDDSHHRQIPRESGCQECGEQFISERRLNMHMRRRHKNGKRDKKHYPCGFCEEVFSKFTSLLKHDDTQHAKLPRNVRCQVCGKMFLSESRIDVHKRIHEERKFQCETCNKSFLSSKCLLVHVRIHSNKFVCNFCGVKKQSLRMLEDHVRVHTGEKLFACQLCGKTFSTKHGKEKHENILHKDRKNFKCDVCDYRSYCSSRLNIHKQTHNIHKKFKCEHCDKLFQTKSTYLHHIKLHTNSNKSYKCLVCSAVFRLKCDLTRHEASHLNLRPYICYICDKSYNRKDLLKAHIRLHNTKKSHSCEKCKRSFKTIKYLKRHKCTAEQEIVVESEGESQENELSNHEMNMDYSDATNIVELGETILNNVDDTVEVTSALDNFEQSPENLNNNALILNDGNLMLINPSVACEVNNSAPLSFYLL